MASSIYNRTKITDGASAKKFASADSFPNHITSASES